LILRQLVSLAHGNGEASVFREQFARQINSAKAKPKAGKK
jgi:hypothetical protein